MELLRLRRCQVLKRVPKASRILAADKLTETLRQVVADPDCVEKLRNLLMFTFTCFEVLVQRGGQRHLMSLASNLNAAIGNFPAPLTPVPQQKPLKSHPSSDNLAARVLSKLEDCDIRGDIRLAASDDTMASFNDVTTEALRSKHPARAASGAALSSPNINNATY